MQNLRAQERETSLDQTSSQVMEDKLKSCVMNDPKAPLDYDLLTRLLEQRNRELSE